MTELTDRLRAHCDTLDREAADEIARLETMMEGLDRERAEAAKDIPRPTLNVFERIAENYNGEAMAAVEAQGKKPPFDYICGGCFMGLNAEHANALQVKSEIRTCDNCGRILYMTTEASRAN